MSSYEELKNLLAKKDFQGALLAAFSNSLQFKLTSKSTNQTGSSSITTKIDLLKGITTSTTDISILNSNNTLMKFHQQQLENIHEIWHQNRQILVTILEILAGNDVSNYEVFTNNSLATEVQPVFNDNSSEVDDIVDLMLEGKDEESVLVAEDYQEDWLGEEEGFSADISETIDNEDNEIEISEEQQQQAEESWDEFMDELSAEEVAVSEEVVVDDVSPDEEIDDDWSEWLGDEEAEGDDVIDWSKEEAIN